MEPPVLRGSQVSPKGRQKQQRKGSVSQLCCPAGRSPALQSLCCELLWPVGTAITQDEAAGLHLPDHFLISENQRSQTLPEFSREVCVSSPLGQSSQSLRSETSPVPSIPRWNSWSSAQHNFRSTITCDTEMLQSPIQHYIVGMSCLGQSSKREWDQELQCQYLALHGRPGCHSSLRV